MAFLLKGAMAKAKAIEEAANVEAAALQAKAKEEGYQEGFSRGSEDGYEEGEKKGEESGLGKHAEATARFETLFTAALAEKDAYFADREAIIIELLRFNDEAKFLQQRIKNFHFTLTNIGAINLFANFHIVAFHFCFLVQ